MQVRIHIVAPPMRRNKVVSISCCLPVLPKLDKPQLAGSILCSIPSVSIPTASNSCAVGMFLTYQVCITLLACGLLLGIEGMEEITGTIIVALSKFMQGLLDEDEDTRPEALNP